MPRKSERDRVRHYYRATEKKKEHGYKNTVVGAFIPQHCLAAQVTFWLNYGTAIRSNIG